jgi:hypothetical protein
MAQKTLLERIEAVYGKVSAFDGRLAFWANSVPHDVRDVARRLKADVGDVCDVMPVFEPVKRGRRSVAVTEDLDGSDSEVSRPDDSDTRV